jgi:hypothetical protein
MDRGGTRRREGRVEETRGKRQWDREKQRESRRRTGKGEARWPSTTR